MLYIFGDDVAVPLTRQARENPTCRFNNPSGRRVATHRGWNQLADLGDSWQDLDSQYSRLEKDLGDMFRVLGIPVPASALRRQESRKDENEANKENASNGEPKGQQVQEAKESKEEANMYRLNIYMGKEFDPDDIKISLKDHVLTVEAKREQKSEDGNSRFYEEVSRKFTIPENVDLNEVKSVFAPNGILRIEAPLPPQQLPEPPKPVAIPITLE